MHLVMGSTFRGQAQHSFPFLANSITTDAYTHIRSIIDSGQPLAEALAQHFGVPPALIRKLGKKPIPSLSGPRSCSALSVSERLELSTTRTLYRALENTIESRFDMITIWDSVLKISKVRERLRELEK